MVSPRNARFRSYYRLNKTIVMIIIVGPVHNRNPDREIYLISHMIVELK